VDGICRHESGQLIMYRTRDAPVQPDGEYQGAGLAVEEHWSPGAAAPHATDGSPCRLRYLHVSIRTTLMDVRGEPANREAVQGDLGRFAQ